jgi:hypothetical protein
VGRLGGRAAWLWTMALTMPLAAALSGGAASTQSSSSPFIVKPYLQLGNAPKLSPSETMVVMWQAADEKDATWSVDVRRTQAEGWAPVVGILGRLVDLPPLPPYRVFKAPLSRLVPGAEFEYRVLKNGQAVFDARGKARAAAEQPHRFLVTGDCGVDSPGQRAMAYRMHALSPDFFAIAGDIVYGTGRMSEYRTKYFPIYNADVADPGIGAPLIRSRLSFGAYGNHDAGYGDVDRDPDGLAYFLTWALPLNGPYGEVGAPNTQTIKGDPKRAKDLAAALRPNFPRMSNYSFDYGAAHWTFIDANVWVDWTDAYLRNWLARDLALAGDAVWKFVVFHQAGFNSSRAHFSEQHMRLVADIFEHRGVDVVFNGHVHNYQRSRPLKFLPKPAANRTFKAGDSYLVDGDFTLDRTFDGASDTTPEGVLYVITGGCGAFPYDPDQTDNAPTWQPFTARLTADVHSTTMVDIDGPRLTLTQISDSGQELDRIVINKRLAERSTAGRGQ